ncbi:MAG: MoaD/ThiS family protein [Cellulomonas sp.]
MQDDVVVTIRYFAGAAAAAGREEERVTLPPGSTVADALAGAGARRGPALARVIAASSVLVDGVHQSAGEATLAGAVTLDVLPPFAGG